MDRGSLKLCLLYVNPPRETSGCQCEINLIGLPLLLEISARQALSSHVPPTYCLPAAANCILLLVCACECDRIYRLSEVPVYLGQENMSDRLCVCVCVCVCVCGCACVCAHAFLRVCAFVIQCYRHVAANMCSVSAGV